MQAQERRKGESLSRRLERGFKNATLPWAARFLAPRPSLPAPGSGTPPAGLPGRILVIRQDNRLGNLLLLTPFLQRLREAAPAAKIGFLCGQVYAPLLKGWPWVDQWIVQEKRRHVRFPWLFLTWLREVRAGGWELAFEASNHNTHSYYQCLMALVSAAPARIGFEHPRSRGALTLLAPPPEETLHFSLAPLVLLRALGLPAPAAPMTCPLTPEPEEVAAGWQGEAGLAPPYLVLHLGGRESKAFPLNRWAALIPRILEIFPGSLVLVAGPTEQHRLSVVAQSVPGAGRKRLLAAPQLPVTRLARLIRDASGFLGCDSGVMHLAVSLGTPTAALFFHSNPYQYAPLGAVHRTVLLADPYGVRDEIWARPVEGLERSVLIRAESAGEWSRRGIPESGPRALEAIARAIGEIAAARAAVG